MDSHSCCTPAKDMMNPLLRNRCEVAIASKSRSSQASSVSRCPGLIEYIVLRCQVAHLCLPNPSLVCSMREASSGHSVTGSIVGKFEDLIGETALGSIRRSRYGDQATESHVEDAFEFLSCNIGTVGVPNRQSFRSLVLRGRVTVVTTIFSVLCSWLASSWSVSLTVLSFLCYRDRAGQEFRGHDASELRPRDRPLDVR